MLFRLLEAAGIVLYATLIQAHASGIRVVEAETSVELEEVSGQARYPRNFKLAHIRKSLTILETCFVDI